MTTSNAPLLYYGFTFTKDEEASPWEPEGEERDVDYDSESWLCDKLGGPKEPDEEWIEGNEQYHKYWDAKRKFIAALPIIIDSHCYIDDPMYFICIRESYHVASRGYPKKLGDGLTKNLGWDPTLQEYCEKLGIEWQQPQWELASMWS